MDPTTGRNTLNTPEDVSLPLFTYGIFKPGQLGFFQVAELVGRAVKASVSSYSLVQKDGIPILMQENNFCGCDGFLLFPEEGKATKFYQTISAMEPAGLYKWETTTLDQTNIDLGRIKANFLLGRQGLGGTHFYEKNCWDGRDDPLFSLGLDEVKRALLYGENAEKEIESDIPGIRIDFPNEYRRLFRYHMAYLLLWTIIERYGTLRYGMEMKPFERNRKIAQENAFIQSLKRVVIPFKMQEGAVDIVFPSNSYTGHQLDSNDPVSSIYYFYAIRCNAAHRGKAVLDDRKKIERATRWLLEIFEDTISAAWDEAEKLKALF